MRRPRRGTIGAGKSDFQISSPARFGAGEELKEGACAPRTELIRLIQRDKDLSINQVNTIKNLQGMLARTDKSVMSKA